MTVGYDSYRVFYAVAKNGKISASLSYRRILLVRIRMISRIGNGIT